MKSKRIDSELLEILACPACKADVTEQDGRVVCQKCKRQYPIEDGVPIMLVERAEI